MYKITCDLKIITHGNIKKSYITTKHTVLGFDFENIEDAKEKIQEMENDNLFNDMTNFKIIEA